MGRRKSAGLEWSKLIYDKASDNFTEKVSFISPYDGAVQLTGINSGVVI